MANPLLGYAANVAGRAVAGIYGAISSAKEAHTPAPTKKFGDDLKKYEPPRKAASSAEKSG